MQKPLRYLSIFLVTTFTMSAALSSSYPADIECEGNFFPSCCTAITDNLNQTQWRWQASKGYYDDDLTTVNHATHHCNAGDKSTFTLTNDERTDPNLGPDVWEHWGRGAGYCASNAF